MVKEILSLGELKNKALGFDRADARDVHVIKNQDDYLCKDVMGVWNLDKNVLACLAPKNYTVIQHKEAAEALIETITSLNIKATAELQTSKHGIFSFVDISRRNPFFGSVINTKCFFASSLALSVLSLK